MKIAVFVLALILFPVSAWARCDATPELNLSSKDALIDKLMDPAQADSVINPAAQGKIDALKAKISDAKILEQPLRQIEEVRTRCAVQMRKNFARFLAAHYTEPEIRDLVTLVGPGRLTTHSTWEVPNNPSPSPLAIKYAGNTPAAIASLQAAVPQFDEEADAIIKKVAEDNQPVGNTVNPYMPAAPAPPPAPTDTGISPPDIPTP